MGILVKFEQKLIFYSNFAKSTHKNCKWTCLFNRDGILVSEFIGGKGHLEIPSNVIIVIVSLD